VTEKQQKMSNDLIAPNLVQQYPAMSASARNWISGIPSYSWVKDSFDFLNRQLSLLSSKQRKEIIKRIVDPKDTKYHEAIAELVYVGFWNYLKWSFEKDPKINGQKPDFRVSYNKGGEDRFIGDVTVVRHNHPEKPIKLNTDSIHHIQKLPLVTQPIQQAHRFLMKIKEKFNKYRNTLSNTPFIICFFEYAIEDSLYLDDFQIRNALYGDLKFDFGSGKLWYQPNIQPAAHGKSDVGIFGFDEYRLLTGVAICREEFYQVSNMMAEKRKPYWKPKYGFSIFPNPLGAWASKEKNPFSIAGFPINGIADTGQIESCEPKDIEFW
jgi:hypothetical protein